MSIADKLPSLRGEVSLETLPELCPYLLYCENVALEATLMQYDLNTLSDLSAGLESALINHTDNQEKLLTDVRTHLQHVSVSLEDIDVKEDKPVGVVGKIKQFILTIWRAIVDMIKRIGQLFSRSRAAHAAGGKKVKENLKKVGDNVGDSNAQFSGSVSVPAGINVAYNGSLDFESLNQGFRVADSVVGRLHHAISNISTYYVLSGLIGDIKPENEYKVFHWGSNNQNHYEDLQRNFVRFSMNWDLPGGLKVVYSLDEQLLDQGSTSSPNTFTRFTESQAKVLLKSLEYCRESCVDDHAKEMQKYEKAEKDVINDIDKFMKLLERSKTVEAQQYADEWVRPRLPIIQKLPGHAVFADRVVLKILSLTNDALKLVNHSVSQS